MHACLLPGWFLPPALLSSFSLLEPLATRPFLVCHCAFFLPNSDLLVGVEHDSDGGSHGSWGQVLGELGADEAALAVGSGNLTPDALVVDASLGVLAAVDEGNALAVVEGAGRTILAVADGNESSVLSLGSLTSLEAKEDALGVKSTAEQSTRTLTIIEGQVGHENWLSEASCSDDLPDGLPGGLRF